jgi:MFS family permease
MVVTTYLRTVRRFSRNVRLYLFVAALMGFTFDGGIHSVIFNLYLLRLGYGPETIGLVNSAGMLAFALGAFPVGALGERWGYRRLLLAGVGAMFVGYLLLPLVEFTAAAWQPSLLVATYVLMNLGLSAFFVNGIPYLMRVTTPEEHNPAFSIQSALISLAAFAGSLLAGFLPDLFAQLLGLSVDQAAPYRYPLLLGALLLVGSVWAITQTSEPPPHRFDGWQHCSKHSLCGQTHLLVLPGAVNCGALFLCHWFGGGYDLF